MEKTKLKALAIYLDCEIDEAERFKEDYLVLTDDEADQAVKEYIRENLWTFYASFIAYHVQGDYDSMKKAIEAMQDKMYEACNEVIYKLINDFDHFVEEAIRQSGRGLSLSTYNGHENECEGFYIYRLN